MSYDDKIKELKIELPEAKPPVGNYVAAKISGKILFISTLFKPLIISSFAKTVPNLGHQFTSFSDK